MQCRARLRNKCARCRQLAGMSVVVVVVFVPVTVGVPTMVVLVPPTMIGRIAFLTLLVQLVPPVVRLAAVSAVMFDCFVKVVVDFCEAFLALVTRLHQGSSRSEYEESCENRGRK